MRIKDGYGIIKIKKMKNRKPRKLKKALQQGVCYDISSTPYDADGSKVSLIKVYDIFQEIGVFWYDSKEGDKPFIFGKSNKRIKFVDLKGKKL